MFPYRNTPSRLQQVTVSSKFIEAQKVKQMKRQRNCSQLKQQEKTVEETNNETEINNLLDKEFKALAIKMLIELG